MTAQIPDFFRYKGKDYEIISVTAPIAFDPCDYSFSPTSPSTACWSGFYARFSAASGKFRLNDLYIYCQDAQYPELFGVTGTKASDSSFVHYRNLRHVLDFTGCLLIGREFREECYTHTAFIRPGYWAYRDVVVLRFINGLLVNVAELSFFSPEEVNDQGPEADLVKVGELKALLKEPLALDIGEDPWFLKSDSWSLSGGIEKKLLVRVTTSIPKKITMMKQRQLSDEFLRKEYLEKITRSALSLKDIPEKFMTEEICLAAVRKNGIAIEFVPKKFLTKELCRIAVATGWEYGAFSYVPKEYLDEEYLIQLIDGDYTWGDSLLMEIPEELRTPKLCFKAVTVNGNALEYVPDAYKTKELCLAAFDHSPLSLTYMPDEFKTEEMCEMAVEELGIMLESVPEEFKTPELCWKAIEEDGDALEYVPENLMTEELCQLAVQSVGIFSRNTYALKYVPEKFMSEELCKMAVMAGAFALKFVPDKYKSAELCQLAYDADRRTIEYIPDELKTEEMREFISDEGSLELNPLQS